jgi:excisionase family DNA binding protein
MIDTLHSLDFIIPAGYFGVNPVGERERATEHSAGLIQLPALSATATAFVRQHPGQAQIAITAALEAAAVQFEFLRSKLEIADSLRPYLVEPIPRVLPLGIIGPEEAAQRLKVSRATVYNWIEAGRLIGWRLTRQGAQIPAEQIVGPGELVAGIDRVLQVIPEPRAAWRFLHEESQHLNAPQRPIDALKAGKLNEVITAAQASGESFT